MRSLFHRATHTKAEARPVPSRPFGIEVPYSPEQLDAPMPHPDDLAAAEPLVSELIAIGRREGYVGTPNGTYDEHWNHRRAREIGMLLNDTGGMQLMLAAHDRVAAALGTSPRGRELEACWGGVGHWMR